MTELGANRPIPLRGIPDAGAFDYDLPAGAIAQSPVEPRSAARMLVDLDPESPAVHGHVSDLPGLVAEGDVVVVNETRVLPARLDLRKATGGAAVVLLLEADPAGPDEGSSGWTALVRPGRRLPPGTVLSAADGTPVVEVGERLDDEGLRHVRLLADLDAHGSIPLPPYVSEPLADPERYQTVYARAPGSVAAPTAGLHLTPELLEAVRLRGAGLHTVDLAVGIGTFRPIVVADLAEHTMHEERYCVPAATMESCRAARARGNRVVAIGTTTVRALESAAATGRLAGRTDLFIRPGYDFRLVDVLLTNFHLPRSSLLVLLSAFAGHGRWRRRYAEALAEGYRFLSFGDAMFVSRSGPRPISNAG